jgi:hypothetical protein
MIPQFNGSPDEDASEMTWRIALNLLLRSLWYGATLTAAIKYLLSQ